MASDGGKSVDGSQIIDISESTVTRVSMRSVVNPIQPTNVQSESEGFLKMKVECQRLKAKLKEKDQENKVSLFKTGGLIVHNQYSTQ